MGLVGAATSDQAGGNQSVDGWIELGFALALKKMRSCSRRLRSSLHAQEPRRERTFRYGDGEVEDLAALQEGKHKKCLGHCLVAMQIPNIYSFTYYIESFDAYM
jgi:hypothetical protein